MDGALDGHGGLSENMAEELTPVFFGGEPPNNSLKISVFGYARPDSTDYWDGNWVRTNAKIKCGGFSGNVSGLMRIDELKMFYDNLKQLHGDLHGGVTFITMEEWLEIKVHATKLGQIGISGFLREYHFTSNRLIFGFEIDQTFLRNSINQLETVLKHFPIRGEK